MRNIGGALLLDKLFGISELWTSNVKFSSPAYRNAVEEFENDGRPQGSRHKIIQRGDNAGNWLALYPSATSNFTRADDKALVLLGNFHGTKILLLSDLGRDGQAPCLNTQIICARTSPSPDCRLKANRFATR